ncbi:MAG: protein kinase [Thermoanaerobaculia bacterium]|nr:protein kinase [Thermoanaerobaculia bacterium]
MGGDSIGPYRITDQLGTGGMGEVFKAYDDRLDRWVAIKRIRPDKEEDADNRERLRREARAAARLSHSSIVHVYDIFQDGDSDCIVMEFVEGRSLNTLITDGPLESGRAAALGREVAEGLAEAHAKGIVHRDLKTENVIVTPGGRAKILDFGLAKPVTRGDFDASLTGKGQVVGTSRAMSPEYVSGESVDHRADLFALGVLLYEILTCQSPFRAQNTLATLKRVILHRQIPVKQLNSEVPEELSDLIDRLLEKEPADRPQSAAEVAQELGRFAGKGASGTTEPLSASFRLSGSSASQTMASIAAKPRSVWRSLALIAAVLATVVAFSQLTWRWLRPPTPEDDFTFVAKDKILITDFENRTGEPLLDDSIDLAFRVGLEQSGYAKVVSRQQVRETLRRMQLDPHSRVTEELGFEICQREAIKALVVGRIGKLGNGYVITAQILDPQTQSSVFSTTDDSVRGQDDILPALQRFVKELRANLGETLDSIEKTQPLEQVTTQNLDALKAYSLAIARIMEDDQEAAIPLLKRAIALDPDFAMAHAKLGLVYRNLGINLAEVATHFERALSSSGRLMDYERLYVEGWVAHANGDIDEEIHAWQLMSELVPDDPTGHRNLGFAYFLYQQRFEDAIKASRAALALEPGPRRSSILDSLGMNKLALGQLEAARADFQKAFEISGETQAPGLVLLNIVERNYAEAKALIDRRLSSSSVDVQAEARMEQISYYADRGELDQALAAIEIGESSASLERKIVEARSLAWKVMLFEQDGRHAEAHAALARCSNLLNELLRTNEHLRFASIPLLTIVGRLWARKGNVVEARKVLAQIEALIQINNSATWKAYRDMLKGEIFLGEGNGRQAIESYKAAIRSLETIQGHEGLARAYILSGDHHAAIDEYRWIAERRGRAFVECGEENCFPRVLNVLDWSSALYNLGKLGEKTNDAGMATRYYQDFLDQYREGGSDLQAYEDAKSRLAHLAQGQPGSIAKAD